PRRRDRPHPQQQRHGRAHRDDLRAGVGVTGERIVVSRILECALVSSAGFARASRVGGGFGGGRLGPLRRSGMGEHIVMIYGREWAGQGSESSSRGSWSARWFRARALPAPPGWGEVSEGAVWAPSDEAAWASTS